MSSCFGKRTGTVIVREQLGIQTDQPDVAAAVRSAERTLADATLRGAWEAIGALAAGDRHRPRRWLAEHARAALEAAVAAARHGDSMPAETAATLLAAARNHAWTGVAGFTYDNRSLLRDAAIGLADSVAFAHTDAAPNARAALGPRRTERTSADDLAILAAALRETADAVQDAGDPAGAAALLDRLRALRTDARAGNRALALPAAGDDAFLGSVRQWQVECDRGDSAAARSLERLAQALVARQPGIAADDAIQSLRAAAFLAAIVHGFLGITPDAARHRVRIAPIPPPDRGSIAVRSLSIADATVSLDLVRSSSILSYHLVQTAGGMPLRVVLEAVVPRVPVVVRLDGRVAELDARDGPRGVVVPVQFDLAAARRVEVEWP